MKKGKMIIISGPSGVGKGTVNKALMEEKDLKLVPSVSMTSRSPRPGEVDGVNYYFVTKEKFEDHIKKDEFLEYAEFIGNYYGTLKSKVVSEIEKGKNVVLEIEVIGATKIINSEPKDEYVSLFLIPPSLKQLENRLRGRGTESEDIIKKRLNKALLEIPLKHNYQYAVILDTIENSIAKIRDILLKENCLEANASKSKFHKLKQRVTKIVNDKYIYFVENWKDNIKTLEIDVPKDINFFDNLVNLLSNRIYNYILENKDFKELEDHNIVDIYIERFILDINFFSLEQEGFLNKNDF